MVFQKFDLVTLILTQLRIWQGFDGNDSSDDWMTIVASKVFTQSFSKIRPSEVVMDPTWSSFINDWDFIDMNIYAYDLL